MDRVLREDGPEHVVHTASSALLLRNRAMMDWYEHWVEEMFPASAKIAGALKKYWGSTAFGVSLNTTESIYKFLERCLDRHARFFGAMEGVGKDPGHSHDEGLPVGRARRHYCRGHWWLLRLQNHHAGKKNNLDPN
ncbi:MAG: hypothetical protein Q9173_000486 [Seirophora scorigena]